MRQIEKNSVNNSNFFLHYTWFLYSAVFLHKVWVSVTKDLWLLDRINKYSMSLSDKIFLAICIHNMFSWDILYGYGFCKYEILIYPFSFI